jgi:hypothetical protein
MNKFTLRPGYLVMLSSRVQGGVNYKRVNLEAKASFARWETTKTIDDPVERKAAEEIRNKARYLITSQCSNTVFGHLCAEADEPELDLAEVKAKALCDEFNRTARFSRVSIRVLRGRIEQNDAKAAKAIVGEMSALIGEMNDGIKNADPDAIRDAMSKAKQMSAILSAEKSEAVAAAVAAAKKAADMISKRILKNGEEAAKVIAEIQIGDLENARMAFLDLSDDLVVEELPAVARVVEIDEASAALESGLALETSVMYDETEVKAAEMRKDFDAIDVPEATSPEV